MRNRSRKPTEADQQQTALGITGQDAHIAPAPPKKNRAAAAMGRAGGLKGGRVRAQRMTDEQRRASAQKAAVMRWAKPPSELIAPPSDTAEPADSSMPISPFAKYKGELSLGGHPVDV